MKLSTHQLKQIIKEELQGVLNENVYEDAFAGWKRKHEKEPKGWFLERLKIINLIEDKLYDQAAMVLTDDGEMFASLLEVLWEILLQDEDFLKEVREFDNLKEILFSFIEYLYKKNEPMFGYLQQQGIKTKRTKENAILIPIGSFEDENGHEVNTYYTIDLNKTPYKVIEWERGLNAWAKPIPRYESSAIAEWEFNSLTQVFEHTSISEEY